VRLVPDKEFDKRTTSALEIVPKDAAAAGFDKVRVWVDRNRWQVLQALLTSSGSVVKARFLGIKTATKAQVRKNPALNLPNNLFTFKTPEGYEVFDSLFP
jgi:outer membrane lipoprotein-sorting protein